MKSATQRFTNEQLIHDNPVYLEADPDDKREPCVRHRIHLVEDGQKIGKTGILATSSDTKQLYWPTILEKFRGRGLGVALYVAAASHELSDDSVRNLQSSRARFLSEGATNVWSALVDRGLATPPDWENGQYIFTGLEH